LFDFLSRYDDQHDGLWLTIGNGNILGSIAIDGLEAKNKGAHLRWFIMDEHYHNQGIGKRLLNHGLDFCKDLLRRSICGHLKA
jgi:GNAT superfamily N-acetyltransferase